MKIIGLVKKIIILNIFMRNKFRKSGLKYLYFPKSNKSNMSDEEEVKIVANPPQNITV